MNGFRPLRSGVLVALALLGLLTLGPLHSAGTSDMLGLATPQKVDVWFRAVAHGTDQERLIAIRLLKAALQSDDGVQCDCVIRYPYDAIGHLGSVGLAPNKGHCTVLLSAIPQLIEALKGESNREAWWILISVQPWCSPANHDLWVKWWNDKGEADFRKMADSP